MNILTVIVCTFNRANILPRCLDSLLAQTVPVEKFNVIIIDNNSTDTTRKVCEVYSYKFKNFKYIFEGRQGLSHARNAGISNTHTEWLAFLDDDAKAHSDWVEKILEAINTYKFDCFGGIYTAWHHLGERPYWFTDDMGTNITCNYKTGKLTTGYFAGGNAIYKTKLFHECGLFLSQFGMNGKNVGYGEETEIIDRFRRSGKIVGFVEDIIIDHTVLPHKYSILWQIKSYFTSSYDYIFISERKKVTLAIFLYKIGGQLYRVAKQVFAIFKNMKLCRVNIIHLIFTISSSLGIISAYFSILRKGKRICQLR